MFDMFIINILLATALSLAAVLIIRHRGKLEWTASWLCFFAGYICLVPALFAGFFVENLPFFTRLNTNVWFRAFFQTALVEETIKFAGMTIIVLILGTRKKWKPVEYVFYSIITGLGFALYENVFYSMGNTYTVLLRGLTAVPLHAAAAGISGYFLMRRIVHKKGGLLIGLILAVILHGFYNLPLFIGGIHSYFALVVLAAGLEILRNLLRFARESTISADSLDKR